MLIYFTFEAILVLEIMDCCYKQLNNNTTTFAIESRSSSPPSGVTLQHNFEQNQESIVL